MLVVEVRNVYVFDYTGHRRSRRAAEDRFLQQIEGIRKVDGRNAEVAGRGLKPRAG